MKNQSNKEGFLTLTRKNGESVIIRDRETGKVLMEVLISNIKGKQVRVSFKAERKYGILRKEIDEKINK